MFDCSPRSAQNLRIMSINSSYTVTGRIKEYVYNFKFVQIKQQRSALYLCGAMAKIFGIKINDSHSYVVSENSNDGVRQTEQLRNLHVIDTEFGAT